jgi:NAD(P)-dependent dehydrogenase (short-subunit alcohol dehydrogenase family)
MNNVLIIGASSGIGRALAEELVPTHRVFGTYNRNAQGSNGNLSYHHLDVLADHFDFSYLPDELHGFVYCPGAIRLKPFARITAAEFAGDYALQVLGAVKTMQHVLPRLQQSKNASAVFFSTVAVQTGFNFHTQVAASKGAIEGLTRALAAEFAPAVRVNCIAPSVTDTPLAATLLNSPEKKENNAQRHPLRKIGQAQDAANLAAFLLSDRAAWMTGQILHLDGGIGHLKV